MANKHSMSMIPLILPMVLGHGWFIFSLFLDLFTDSDWQICWPAGIMGVVCYGFIAIRNFMENSHFENLNQ